MVGAEERRKLIERLGDDPAYPLIAVFKCLAALLVLVGIAAGPWAFLAASNPSGGTQAAAPANRMLAEGERSDINRSEAPETGPRALVPAAPDETSPGE